MARVALSFLLSLIIYFAYCTLASEALPGAGSTGAKDGPNGPPSDGSLNEELAAWLKNGLKRRTTRLVGLGAAGGLSGSAGNAAYQAYRRSLPQPTGNGATGGLGRLPASLGYVVADLGTFDDEDIEKRFDDYGHMRFGKRGGEGDQFDDYGHMRFG